MKISNIVIWVKNIFIIAILLSPSIAFIYYNFLVSKAEYWFVLLIIAIISLLIAILYLYTKIKDLKGNNMADEYEKLLKKGYSEKEIDQIMKKKFGKIDIE